MESWKKEKWNKKWKTVLRNEQENRRWWGDKITKVGGLEKEEMGWVYNKDTGEIYFLHMKNDFSGNFAL